MENKVNDLRSALALLKSIPGQLIETDAEVEPMAELSGVYRHVGAGGTVMRPTKEGPASDQCWLIKVTAVTHRKDPIMQTCIGPSEEHVSMAGIPTEASIYHKPQTIEEMVYHLAAKLVEPFGIAAKEYRRWNGM